jgi:succinate dehydrogenase hydrophobic anchor subunit
MRKSPAHWLEMIVSGAGLLALALGLLFATMGLADSKNTKKVHHD